MPRERFFALSLPQARIAANEANANPEDLFRFATLFIEITLLRHGAQRSLEACQELQSTPRIMAEHSRESKAVLEMHRQWPCSIEM